MEKYRCEVCGYVYDPVQGDPNRGVRPDSPFKELPEEWCCPVCGAGKENFSLKV